MFTGRDHIYLLKGIDNPMENKNLCDDCFFKKALREDEKYGELSIPFRLCMTDYDVIECSRFVDAEDVENGCHC